MMYFLPKFDLTIKLAKKCKEDSFKEPLLLQELPHRNMLFGNSQFKEWQVYMVHANIDRALT
jgi:hypothetical protein